MKEKQILEILEEAEKNILNYLNKHDKCFTKEIYKYLKMKEKNISVRRFRDKLTNMVLSNIILYKNDETDFSCFYKITNIK